MVCLLVMTKPIDIPFGVRTRIGPLNHILGGAWILPRKGAFLESSWPTLTCPYLSKVHILNLIRI